MIGPVLASEERYPIGTGTEAYSSPESNLTSTNCPPLGVERLVPTQVPLEVLECGQSPHPMRFEGQDSVS